MVCSKDTDVLILMVFVYAFSKISEKQVMKTESNKFINIQKINLKIPYFLGFILKKIM